MWLVGRQSVGCFSCFSKPKPNKSKDVLTKRLGNSSRREKKPSVSEDLWSSIFFDMDNSVALSRGSFSSISTTNHSVNPHSSDPGASEFVNPGLLLWNQMRQQWIGNRKAESRGPELLGPKLSWNAAYENLLGSNKQFAQRIPLAKMVNFLVDIWEQEGMYG